MKSKSELLNTFLGALKLPSSVCKEEGYLSDSQLLSRLIDNEDLPSFGVAFAIEDIFQSVGIKIMDNLSLLKSLPEKYSINDVIDLVYDKQHKTVEDVKQFFLDNLGLSKAYQENPDIINCRVLDGIPAKYGNKKVSVTSAVMQLFKFVGADFSHDQMSYNPTFAEVINLAFHKQS